MIMAGSLIIGGPMDCVCSRRYSGTGNFSLSFWLAPALDADVGLIAQRVNNDSTSTAARPLLRQLGANGGVRSDRSEFRGLFYKGFVCVVKGWYAGVLRRG